MTKQIFEASRSNVFHFEPERLTIIGLDTSDGPTHHLYDARAFEPLQEAMVLDILKRGVVVPIVVQKDGDRALVVEGRRRVLHAREANRRLSERGLPTIKVPALPKKGTEAEMFEVMVALNELRKEDSAINRARKMSALLGMGRTQDEVASLFGVSVGTVINTLSLLDLCSEGQQALSEGRVKLTKAYSMAKLSREAQLEKLSGKKAEPAPRKRGPNRAELEAKIASLKGTKDPETRGFVRGLQYALGLVSDEG